MPFSDDFAAASDCASGKGLSLAEDCVWEADFLLAAEPAPDEFDVFEAPSSDSSVAVDDLFDPDGAVAFCPDAFWAAASDCAIGKTFGDEALFWLDELEELLFVCAF